MIVDLMSRIAVAFQRGDATTSERATLQSAVQGLTSADQLPEQARKLLSQLEQRAT